MKVPWEGLRPYAAPVLAGGTLGAMASRWLCGSGLVVQNDTWWQIVAGGDIWAGRWPTVNAWSWSLPHVHWMVQEPWFDVLEWGASHCGYYGLAGLTLFFAVLCGFFLASRFAGRRDQLLLVGAFFGLTFFMWESRPQVADYAGLAFLYWAVERRRYGLIPPAVALWANLHSGVVIVPLVLAVFAGESWLKQDADRGRLTLLVALTLLATLATKNGTGVWVYAVRTVLAGGAFGRFIQEWMPPPFWSCLVSGEYLLVLAAPLLLALRGKKRLPGAEVFIFLAFYFMALRSYRFMPYMIMAWLMVLVRLLPAGRPAGRHRGFVFAGVMLAAFAVAVTPLGLPPKSLAATAAANGYPVGAAGYIKRHHLTHVFNDYDWGGYLVYAGIPVYIDGRSEVYLWNRPDIFLEYNFATYQLKNVEAALRGSDVALLRKGSPLAKYLEATGWNVVRTGRSSILLERGDSRVTKGCLLPEK